MTKRLLSGVLFAWCALSCSAKEGMPVEASEHERRASLDIDAGAPQLAYIKVETVGESDEGATVTLTGRVAFNESHTQRVASPIDGRATRVAVEVGDEVKLGQVLVELSSPNIGQLQGDVKKAEQDVALTSKALARAKSLLELKAIAARDLTQAEVDFAKAQADLASTRARFGSMNLALGGGGAGIRAQVGGTVVERSVLVGQEVRADQTQPLMTVSDLSTVWVVGDLFEQDLALARAGADVEVTVAAYPGVKFAGKVLVLGSVVDTSTRTIRLRALVPNPDGRLKPEMFARIALRDAEARQLSVPVKAVLADTQPPRVIVVEGQHYATREVEVGPEVAGRVRVFSGLKKGERVVTEGAIFLKQEIVNQ